MASRSKPVTTFEPGRVLRPVYTGGDVAVSQDGRILASCLGEDAVLTDIETREELCRIEGDGEPITALCMTPSSSHLLVCSRSLSMRVYGLETAEDSTSITAELLRTLKPHAVPVAVSAVDGSSTLFATGGADGIVKVWDIRGGFVTHTFHGHGGVVSALHFFDVGTLADVPHGQTTTRKHKSAAAEDNGDGTLGLRLASGGDDGRIRVWNLHTRKSTANLDSHASMVRSLDYSQQEHALVAGSRDRTATIWDGRVWKQRKTIPLAEEAESVGFLGNGALIYTGGARGKIRLWSTSTGAEVTEEQKTGTETEVILRILSLESSHQLLSVHGDQTLLFHDLSSLSNANPSRLMPSLPILKRISGTFDEVIDLTFVGPNRNLLAIATNLDNVRLVNAETEAASNGTSSFGSDVAILEGHEDIIITLSVDWSGHWLATGAKDNSARLWRLDPETRAFTCYAVFTGHAESVGAVALPPSQPAEGSAAYLAPLSHPPSYLITGSQDTTVKRWEIPRSQDVGKKAPRSVYTRKAHDKDINAIDINHDGTLFASASQDRTVKIWSTDGETLGVLRGHRRGVWSVKFSPKDLKKLSGIEGVSSIARGLVLTGSGDKTVKLWNLADFSCIRTFEGHTNSVLKVVWLMSPNEEASDERKPQAASAGGDGLVKVWDIEAGEQATTLDNHEDRVWAIACPPKSRTLVSGGGDGVITFWTDTTASTVAAAARATNERIEQEQTLQNHIRAGSYREAITLALQLNQPARLLSIFSSVVNTYPREDRSLSGLLAVDEVLGSLGNEQLARLLTRLRDWNTNTRTAPVAQRILSALVRLYPAERLASLRVSVNAEAKVGGLKDILNALQAYSERHLQRMEDLSDESYLVEYTLQEMNEVVA